MTASVTMTATALMPAILMRNGTPVAARRVEIVTGGVVITHSTRNAGERLLSDHVFQMDHVY